MYINCQHPIERHDTAEGIESGFCPVCRDVVGIIWNFEDVNPDLDIFDEEQRDAAMSLLYELGGMKKTLELASFVVGLEILDKPLILSPMEMLESLEPLVSIYEMTKQRDRYEST